LNFVERSIRVHNGAQSKTFLIAESDAVVVSTIRQALEPEGHSILTVVNGDTALEVFAGRKDEIGFVITRITLPGLSGIELLDRALAIKPRLCHLVISHYDIDLLRLIPGFQKYRPNFLPKPFTAEALLMKVNAQLSGSHE
jgi:DNA-binding NtrC family response regulator